MTRPAGGPAGCRNRPLQISPIPLFPRDTARLLPSRPPMGRPVVAQGEVVVYNVDTGGQTWQHQVRQLRCGFPCEIAGVSMRLPVRPDVASRSSPRRPSANSLTIRNGRSRRSRKGSRMPTPAVSLILRKLRNGSNRGEQVRNRPVRDAARNHPCGGEGRGSTAAAH